MKFPRNARIVRGQLDAAPFASVFFLLVIFVLLGSLLYTPGVRVQLPVVDGSLPGPSGPSVTVAMDAAGRLYFKNQLMDEDKLKAELQALQKNSREPLTLVVQADKAASYGDLLRLRLLARSAGINDAWFAALPANPP